MKVLRCDCSLNEECDLQLWVHNKCPGWKLLGVDSWERNGEGNTALNVPTHSSTPRPVTLTTMKQFKKCALVSEEHILALFFFSPSHFGEDWLSGFPFHSCCPCPELAVCYF